MSCLPPRQVLQVSRNRTEMSEAQRVARLSTPVQPAFPGRMGRWLARFWTKFVRRFGKSPYINETIN